MNKNERKVPRRIAQTILNSLKGGVVPRIGLPYIAVGRKNEIEALLHDVDIIAEGGASFRFIVGRYGSGKSFLIQTIRNYVMDRGFIVADADLSPERRLQGSRGQGLATYRELISNLSTKTRPEGGALTLVLDRWISGVQSEAVRETGLTPGDAALTQAVDQKIYAVTSAISEMVHGFEFAFSQTGTQCLIAVYAPAAVFDGLRRRAHDDAQILRLALQSVIIHGEQLLIIILSGDGIGDLVKIDQLIDHDHHARIAGMTEKDGKELQIIIPVIIRDEDIDPELFLCFPLQRIFAAEPADDLRLRLIIAFQIRVVIA